MGAGIQCSGGVASVQLDSDYVGSGKQQYWPTDTDLSVFNAGDITTSTDEALHLLASRVTYVGAAGGFLKSDYSAALRVDALSAGVDIDVSHDIDGATGIVVDVASGASPDVQIDLLAGEAKATVTGIDVQNWSAAPTQVTIGQGAIVKAPIGLWLRGASGSHVVLAGSIAERVAGEGQASWLTEGDDILELRPGYALDGTIDSGTGTNELRLGGAGTATFELGDIGTSFLNFTAFTKTGPSAWTLHGSAATSLGMDVQSGTLNLDNADLGGGTFVVGDDARLTGTGSLGDIELSGTLVPGSFAAGTLTAADVTFYPGSILEIEIGPGGAPVLEVASIDATTVDLHVIASQATGGIYDVLFSAVPLTANFAVDVRSPRYSADLLFDPDKQVLSVDLAQTGVTFASYARTPDQAAVAALLDAMGEAAPYYAQLDGMDPAAAAELMGQMAGSGFAATNGALLQQSGTLSDASLGRIQQQAGSLGPAAGPFGYAAFSTDTWYDGLHPSAWGRLIAGTSTIGGSTAGSTALVGGVDVELGDDWTLGLLAAMGSSAIAAGNASTNSFDVSAGFYGAKEWGTLALRFGGSLTHHSVGSRRRVTGPGVDETLIGSYGALTGQLFAELAQELDFGPVGIELFGDLAYARHFSPGFTETGGAGALTVAAASSDAVDTTLGARITQQVAMGTRLVTLGATIGWKHRWTAVPTTYNSFAGAAPFPVAGISTAGSALVAGANLRLDLDEESGLDLAYALEWGSTGAAHSISAKYAQRF